MLSPWVERVEIATRLLGRWESHALRLAYLIAGIGIDLVRRDAPNGHPCVAGSVLHAPLEFAPSLGLPCGGAPQASSARQAP